MHVKPFEYTHNSSLITSDLGFYSLFHLSEKGTAARSGSNQAGTASHFPMIIFSL